MTTPKLGIVAGRGSLPSRVIAACRDAGRPHFVVAFEGITEADAIAAAPHAWVRLGAAERTLGLLRTAGVADVVLAGPVGRPSLARLALDRRALKLALGGRRGDDGILSRIVREFETEGFRVVGIDDVLVDLVAPAGVLGRHAPDDEAEADIAAGLAIAAALGALDVGQAVVVQEGLALGVEAVEGTDALIARCAALGRGGPGGVLVKIKKPGQERRADLPTIGVGTVAAAAAAGLRGIAVEAGETLIVDRAATVAAADAAGLFLVGIARETAP